MNRSRINDIRIMIAASLLIASLMLVVVGTSFFVQPVTADLDISRSSFMIHYTLFTLLSLVTMPLASKLLNRFDIRFLIVLGGCWTGLGLVFMSLTSTLWEIYLVGIWVGVSLFPASNYLVAVLIDTSFAQRKGILLGLATGFGGLGAMVASAVLPNLIAEHGWRSGYQVLGSMVVVTALTAATVVKNRHSLPGPRPTATSDAGAPGIDEMTGMPYPMAMKSKNLWCIFVGVALFCSVLAGQEHYPAHLYEHGVPSDEISMLMSLFFFFGIPAIPLVGWLVDRFGLTRTASAIWVAATAGWTTLAVAEPDLFQDLGVLALVAITANGMLPAIIAGLAFGQRSYARLVAVLLPAGTLGLAIGAPLWGLAYDIAGAYTPAFFLSPMIMGVGFVLAVVGTRRSRVLWAHPNESRRAKVAGAPRR
ncbi:hypothetical protein H351_30795 (plasmid) [Rhodococcus erythropolis R138]|uniref:MFS transporter n=1 Tax=Rhodococcus erythropolis TaxID=1833 RepID=UPI0004928584|nr:MFS transporter [Rhodococcus erythropolis]ALU73703.1 hypothetical protein H351_30795 [Rhodococcus erythropolis R138]